MRARAILACVVVTVAMAATGTTSVSATTGFKTAEASMLTVVKSGVTATPLLTVGETIPGTSYRFESIPDGISVHIGDDDQIELFVNHETSKVPFPFNTNAPSAATGQSDFDNAQVSKLLMDSAGGFLSGEFVIDSSAGFQRFCSNYLATSKEGFTKDILFTNEESPDYATRTLNSWPPPLSNAGAEENGVVLAYDVAADEYTTIYGMGRHNHENDVAIPGFDKLVVMSGDDTFTSGPLSDPTDTTAPITQLAPSQSELYSYQVGNTKNLIADKGDLWAFVTDDPDVTNYYDFAPGSTDTVSGHFIKVPKNIATGQNKDGSEITSADVGYPAPPTDGSWQRDLRDTSSSGPPVDPQIGIDGPQWVLEYWSQINHVFDFVRVEDLAYDKRPGMGNVVYVIDSGRGRRSTDTLDTPFRSTNGRVWKMVLDPNDPKNVLSFGIIVEGDDDPVKTFTEIHQPDNIETTATGFLVTEDPGSSNQFAPSDVSSDATTARLWFVPYAGDTNKEIVAKVNQSADGGPTDVGPAPTADASIGNQGAWESSGIVDASAAFGDGYYLIDVQAHTLWVEKSPGVDTYIDAETANPDFTYKREGGQLLLLHIPGI